MARGAAAIFGLLLTIALAGGCKQQCFLSEEVFNQTRHLMPAHLEKDPTVGVLPLTEPTPAPADVNSPDRPKRFLSLPEAIAIALENGTTGGRAGVGQGLADDNPIQLQGGALVAQIDNIRVLALQPAIQGANVEAALSRFDANWVSAMSWTTTDNLQQGLASLQNGQQARLENCLAKFLPTGGAVEVASITSYQFLDNPPGGDFVNPLYSTQLRFGFEQPLWRDFGVDINQLFTRPPTVSGEGISGRCAGVLNGRGVQQTEGILLSRLRFDQQRAEFERNVHLMLLNVEVAYWRLYQAYGRLYSFEEVLATAHRAWTISKGRFDAGILDGALYFPVRAQFREFQAERRRALGDVLERERNLRGLIGLPIEDGTRLVPATPPTLAPYQPNWEAALQDAMALKPELVLARENLRAAQFNVITQKNFLKPDVRFFAHYTPLGFGSRLDGNGVFIDSTGTPRPNNALRSLSHGHFADYNLGLLLNVPLGFREAHSMVRTAQLTLAQNYYLLHDQEERARRTLAQYYQKLTETYGLIRDHRGERKDYALGVENRLKKITLSVDELKGNIDALLENQRRLALAQVKEFEAVAEYNSNLARFEWARGTIMQYQNVVIAEGPLPECAAVRAVEHERQRSRALEIRERPAPETHPGFLAGHNVPYSLETPLPLDDLASPLHVPVTNDPEKVEPLPIVGEPPPPAQKATEPWKAGSGPQLDLPPSVQRVAHQVPAATKAAAPAKPDKKIAGTSLIEQEKVTPPPSRAGVPDKLRSVVFRRSAVEKLPALEEDLAPSEVDIPTVPLPPAGRVGTRSAADSIQRLFPDLGPGASRAITLPERSPAAATEWRRAPAVTAPDLRFTPEPITLPGIPERAPASLVSPPPPLPE
jgi:outer membrane protein TolC